jgi:hypothetical protein
MINGSFIATAFVSPSSPCSHVNLSNGFVIEIASEFFKLNYDNPLNTGTSL